MQDEITLHFTRSEYRILLIADIQERASIPKIQLDALRAIIDHTKPDLAILLGDIVFGPLTHRKRAVFSVIDAINGIMQEKSLNYLVVSGNHDTDSLTKWNTQLARYTTAPSCLSPGIAMRECAGAYSACLVNRDGTPVCRFLLFDSTRTVFNHWGMDYLPYGNDVLEWERARFSHDDLDTYIFQHIPVREIYSLLYRVKKQKNAVPGRGLYRGAYFLPDPATAPKGTLGEAPCPPWNGGEQFSDWVKYGRTRAAFFGHDHMNDLEGTVSGIRLVYTPTAGLRCYGTDTLRGARLLRFNSEGEFETEMVYYNNIFKEVSNHE